MCKTMLNIPKEPKVAESVFTDMMKKKKKQK